MVHFVRKYYPNPCDRGSQRPQIPSWTCGRGPQVENGYKTKGEKWREEGEVKKEEEKRGEKTGMEGVRGYILELPFLKVPAVISKTNKRPGSLFVVSF